MTCIVCRIMHIVPQMIKREVRLILMIALSVVERVMEIVIIITRTKDCMGGGTWIS